jgi:hypothetical protein
VAWLWNQAAAIWFPINRRDAAKPTKAAATGRLRFVQQRSGVAQSGASRREAVAPRTNLCMSAQSPREGGQGLSAKNGSDTAGPGESRGSRKSTASERSGKTRRPNDLGRALRSVYDDTLREPVPDDFLSLIGKLD